MYKAPINIYTSTFIPNDVIKQQEANIYRAVINSGISVDKEELLQALQYDRNQYHEGYMAGKADAIVHGQWEMYKVPPMMCCSECDWGTAIQSDFNYCPNCGAKMDGRSNVPRYDNE